MKNIAALFGTLGLVDRDPVRTAFFEAFAFNVLVGGTDAHAKNYSLLLRGSRVALAPLYDAASYAPYLRSGEAMRGSMKVGENWQVRDVTVEDWTTVATALDLEPDDALARVERLRRDLPAAVSTAADLAPEKFTKDASRVAAAVARQKHLTAPRLPRARRSRP